LRNLMERIGYAQIGATTINEKFHNSMMG